MMTVTGAGTKEKPWQLKTPSGLSPFQAYRDESNNPPALVVTVGATTLQYQLRCLDDLHAMLQKHGDWMALGSADEQNLRGRHGGGLGPVAGQPRWRVVRDQEGTPRSVRQLHTPRDGGPRPRGGRAPAQEQPHAGAVIVPVATPLQARLPSPSGARGGAL